MKAAFLKIAGVKTDQEFYKLFPSEASFFKKHPEAKQYIKTAQNGADLNNDGIPDLLQTISPIQNRNEEILPNYNVPTNKYQSINQITSSDIQPFKAPQLKTMTPEKIGENLSRVSAKTTGMLDKMGGVGGIASSVGGIVQGFQMLEEGKKAKKEANQFNEYSKVALMASQTRPEEIKRKYVRPEDNIISGDQFFPINGVGTNVLARNGYSIPEAQEGYELTDGDYANFGAMGSQLYSGLTSSQNSGSSKIGSSVGTLAGTAIGGPIGGAIGGFVGTVAGDLLDNTGRETKKLQDASKRNMDQMFLQNSFRGSQQMNRNYMKDGGELSQLEESGELQTMWGGDVEPISNNPYTGETLMFRGQSHNETDNNGNSGIGINYGNNPVEVERGEPATVLPNSNTGEENLVIFGNVPIGIIGANILEDPKLKNVKFKNQVATFAKKENKLNTNLKKLKNTEDTIINKNSSYSKIEQNTIDLKKKGIDLNLLKIANQKKQLAELQTIYNNTAEEHGFKADDLARGKITRDTTKANELKEAMYGYEIPKAQVGLSAGKKIRSGTSAKPLPNYIQSGADNGYFSNMTEEDVQRFKDRNRDFYAEQNIDVDKIDFKSTLNPKYDPKNKKSKEPKYIGSPSLLEAQRIFNVETDKYQAKLPAGSKKLVRAEVDGKFGENSDSLDSSSFYVKSAKTPQVALDANQNAALNKTTPDKPEANRPIIEYKRSPYIDAFNQVLPFLRPSNATELDGNQLLGEMYGMSSNQLEPVQSQNYRPELRTPYDISFQDQLNEITASERAAQRMSAYNPEAASQIAAQSYQGKSRVLADQFRANQAMKEGVYSQNTATLNDAQLKNLAFNDQQYTRQAQAKSNTKAINQSILNSISSKYQQNKLENRTLGIQENMYNYRFDKAGRAINMNPLYQANVDQDIYVFDKSGKATHEKMYDSNKKFIGYKALPIYSETEDVTPIQPEISTPAFNNNSQISTISDMEKQRIEEEKQSIANSSMKNGGFISNSALVKSLK